MAKAKGNSEGAEAKKEAEQARKDMISSAQTAAALRSMQATPAISTSDDEDDTDDE